MHKSITIGAYCYLLFIISASLGRFVIGILPTGIKHSDKIGHALAYCVFVLIWGSFFYFRTHSETLHKRIFKSSLKAFIFAATFGVIMEIAQWGLTSYRQFDVLDMLANTSGALIGMLLFNVLTKYLNFIKKSRS